MTHTATNQPINTAHPKKKRDKRLWPTVLHSSVSPTAKAADGCQLSLEAPSTRELHIQHHTQKCTFRTHTWRAVVSVSFDNFCGNKNSSWGWILYKLVGTPTNMERQRPLRRICSTEGTLRCIFLYCSCTFLSCITHYGVNQTHRHRWTVGDEPSRDLQHKWLDDAGEHRHVYATNMRNQWFYVCVLLPATEGCFMRLSSVGWFSSFAHVFISMSTRDINSITHPIALALW